MKPESQSQAKKLRESLMSEQIERWHVEDAAELVKKNNKMIKSKKNNILTLAYKQGIIFRKFKKNNRFTNAVSDFKMSKTTTNFKVDIVKFIDDYPKMRTSCISLFYLKKKQC